ncbi:MAG: hypothetical protein F4073_11215 [Rhodobacteraceae bacterium]|nr:hypothetical protein [Gemmatimonadota bacterium]MYF46177.1 hypothetical protein [Paracoccaceae bacterium]MYI92502.1 hypothetical protein [Paracoccaceae bacterium]
MPQNDKLLKYSKKNQNHVSLKEKNLPLSKKSEKSDKDSKKTIKYGTQPIDLRHSPLLWSGPVLILVLAILPWPYGYYIFLRILISSTCAVIVFYQWKHDDAISSWVFIFVGVGILYNPFLPIHLTREIWTILNIITAGLFIGHYFMLKKLLLSHKEANPSKSSHVSEDVPSRRKLNSTIQKYLDK